ncbi:MAG: DNA recombination protein RmuC [Rickettsiales bacterium]|jgi:DNA recombination protein RmuC|nr:DNA recombination protein RmuC [Rickettsiales bacterium]
MASLLFITIFLLVCILVGVLVLITRKSDSGAAQFSSLREDNSRLRERLAERLGVLSQNAIELKNISGDIANLGNVLMGSKQARGTFGERQLEDIVSDIMPPESYAFQKTLDSGVRPDCIIRLPYPPGDMIIDSKFPLEGFAKYTENPDDGNHKIFELSVRKHIDDIASKYIIVGKTAESAMMFIAAESIFETLHRDFSGLVDYAARKKVFIVSPATLWASLNTIRAVLSDIKIKRVAGQIKKELDLLLSDLTRLSDRANKLDSHFNNATTDLRELQTSVGKISPRAEKLRDLDF